MSTIPYKVGRFFAYNKAVTLAVVISVAVIWWVGSLVFEATPQSKSPQTQPSNSVPSAASVVQRIDPMVATCTTGIDHVIARANAFVKDRKIEMAYNILHDCKQHMVDPGALELYKKLTIETTKITQRNQEKSDRELKAMRKRDGVAIGMSKQEVVDSNWGRPRKINRTTRSSGTKEQWVYDGGYLYFENDVLTAIQN